MLRSITLAFTLIIFFSYLLVALYGASIETVRLAGIGSVILFALGLIFIPRLLHTEFGLRLEAKYLGLQSQLEARFRKNNSPIKMAAASLMFMLGLILASALGDFEIISTNDPIPLVRAIFGLRIFFLALISVFNVYQVPKIFQQADGKKAKLQFDSMLVGFFGLILCCPMLAIMNGSGLAVMIYLFITGFHILLRAPRGRFDTE